MLSELSLSDKQILLAFGIDCRGVQTPIDTWD